MAEVDFFVDRGELNQFIETRMGMDSSQVVDVCNRWIMNSDEKGDDYRQMLGYYYMTEVYVRTELVYEKDDMQRWIQEGVLLCEKNEYWDYLVRFYNLRGSFFSWFEDYVTAIETFQEALQLCKLHGFEELRGKLIGNIAIVYIFVEDYQEAVEYLLESIKSPLDAEVELNFWNMVNQYFYLATAYLELGEVEMAYRCQLDIENLIEGRGSNEYFRFGVLILFGRVALGRKDWDGLGRMIELLLDTKERFQYTGIYDKESYSYIELLYQYQTHCKKPLFDEIERVLMKMKETYDDEPTIRQLRRFYQEMLRFYQRTNQCDEYRKYARKLIEIMEKDSYESGENLLDVVHVRGQIKQLKIKQYKEKLRKKQLDHQSKHDELTGLFNRRGLEYYAEQWMERGRLEQKNYGVGIIDVDKFKKINDEQGHLQGDECLAILGSIIIEMQTEQIVAARYGGDEFVVLFFDYSNDEIEEYAQKIQQRIEDSKSGFTISQGYANIIPQIQMKQWDYLTRADEMLYQVKKQGGNHFQVYRRIK